MEPIVIANMAAELNPIYAVVAQYLIAGILAVTLFVIIWQLREQNKLRKLQAYNHLYDTLASVQSRTARRKLFEANRDKILDNTYDALQDKEHDELRHAIGQVTSDYDHIGKLVHSGQIDHDFACEMFGGSAYRMFKLLRNYLDEDNKRRRASQPWNIDHFHYFKTFVIESEKYWDKRLGRGREMERLNISLDYR